MEKQTVYFCIILAIVLLDFSWSQYLSYRNRKRMSPTIPKLLEGIYDAEDYAKQQKYQKINSQLGLYTSLFSFIVLLFILLLGGFGVLDNYLRLHIQSEIPLTLAFLGIIYVANEIISLPFEYYQTFYIENCFGFNTSTKKTFWFDQLKSFALTTILGGVVLTLIAWFYTSFGSVAWVYAWGTITCFTLLMLLFYSNIIVPLFNKQTPLNNGNLRDSIDKFAKKGGFNIDTIYVMDASKRTTKANAYFTGLGAKKRIVLYDTLINDLSTEQIVAVLAHEIGHYKKKHTLQSVLISISTTGFILYILSFFLNNQSIAQALGGTIASFHLGLIAFSFLFSPISMLLGIFSNILSRRNEYQADAYAASFGLGDSLIGGLKKLSIKSLSNLNPDPLYVFVHYSHPTLLQRIERLSC